MSEQTIIASQPGVRRDGTVFSSGTYRDAVWVRFQRGLPRSMGGYQSISREIPGVVRGLYLDSRLNTNTAHYFSRQGILRQVLSDDGAGLAIADRTPAAFDTARDYTWTHASLFSSTGGSYSALVAAATPDVSDLASDEAGGVYSMGLPDDGVAVPVEDAAGPITTSGGVVTLQPFLFIYGSNGLIRNSNANDFSAATGWTAGGGNFANSNNPSASKVVFAAQIRGGGQTPAGLFWALDSLIRVGFTSNATTPWSYDVLSSQSTILSKRCVVEVDGRFFWIGIDRFFTFNGVLQELPNTFNLNWFFDNLNRAQANKVWGTTLKRWGEIWWFFPSLGATECDTAVIYNYRENIWYDAAKTRSAGDAIGAFRFPVWVGEEDSITALRVAVGTQDTTSAATLAGSAVLNVPDSTNFIIGRQVLGAGVAAGSTVASKTATTVTLSLPTTGVAALTGIICSTFTGALFPVGDTVTGGTSGATGVVVSVTGRVVTLRAVAGTFVTGEALTASIGAATVLATPEPATLSTAYLQEVGTDKLVDAVATPLHKTVTTADFGLAVAGSLPEVKALRDSQTTVTRAIPDFRRSETLQLAFLGRDAPTETPTVVVEQEIDDATTFLQPRAQARLLNMRMSTNVVGGSFEAGRVIIAVEPGGSRSGVET